jgi:hypothetical protein
MLELYQDNSLYAQGKVDYCMIKSNLTWKFLEKETFIEGNQLNSLHVVWKTYKKKKEKVSGMYSLLLER